MNIRIGLLPTNVVTLSPEHPPATSKLTSLGRFAERRMKASILRIMRENVLCSMATITKQHRAHISHVYFCYSENLELYFLSDPTSLHCRNTLTNPSMAITIFSSDQKWTQPGRGMQLFGSCGQAKGNQATKAQQLYGKRFPAYRKWRADRQEFRYRFFRFTPRSVKMLDEQEFGDGVFVEATVKRI